MTPRLNMRIAFAGMVGLLLPLSLLALSGTRSLEQDGRRESFTLSDQYGKAHEQVFPKNRISVFALADRKGSKQLENWIEPFYKRYADQVDICGVANLKGVPGFMKPMLRGLFKKGIKYPVMMDWSGEICEALGYEAGKANIYVLCPEGIIRYRVNGGATEEYLQECFAMVDDLMSHAAGAAQDEGSVASECEAGTTEVPPKTAATCGKPGKAA